MSDEPRVPAPTELIYLPKPSWLPLIAAAGIAALLAGVFTGWIYSLVGAIFLLIALGRWATATGDEMSRLPRRQRPTSAILPATELERRNGAK